MNDITIVKRLSGEHLIGAVNDAGEFHYVGRIMKKNTQQWAIYRGFHGADLVEIGHEKRLAQAIKTAKALFSAMEG